MPRPLRSSGLRALGVTGVTALALTLAATAFAVPAGAAAPRLSWQLKDTGTINHFRGLSPVSAKVAWLGGFEGQVLRTLDGGRTWQDVSPTAQGAEDLQYRDIEATSADHAVLMAAGEGDGSELLVTDDGGAHWTTTYGNTDATPGEFFDCMSFSDTTHGLVVSDPVGGRFRILSTSDAGHSWSVVPPSGMPPAQAGEAAFAASGECLATSGTNAWFGTGGGAIARIYHSTDRGRTWTFTTSTLRTTATGGVFGLAFQTPYRGVAVGGDFDADTVRTGVAATQLAGRPWLASSVMPGGYRSGVTFLPGTNGTVIAVGPTGSDVSTDGGKTWTAFAKGTFDTVSCSADGACWASGESGRVAVLRRG